MRAPMGRVGPCLIQKPPWHMGGGSSADPEMMPVFQVSKHHISNKKHLEGKIRSPAFLLADPRSL